MEIHSKLLSDAAVISSLISVCIFRLAASYLLFPPHMQTRELAVYFTYKTKENYIPSEKLNPRLASVLTLVAPPQHGCDIHASVESDSATAAHTLLFSSLLCVISHQIEPSVSAPRSLGRPPPLADSLHSKAPP